MRSFLFAFLGLGAAACGTSKGHNDAQVFGDATEGECRPGERVCGTTCVDTRSDPAHCGDCDAPCPGGFFCADGMCSQVCASPFRECGGNCVDLASTSAHCGDCNNPCASDRMCTGAQCVCRDRLSDCGGSCVDTDNDRNNCGRCGRTCGATENCLHGSCLIDREANCTDNADDDGDNLLDCADPDCTGVTRPCTDGCPEGEESCQQDGTWSDCMGCAPPPQCELPTDCDPGFDCVQTQCTLDPDGLWDVFIVDGDVPRTTYSGASWDYNLGYSEPDPYVEVGTLRNSRVSSTQDDTFTPAWAERVLLGQPARDIMEGLRFKMTDDDLCCDDLIGECTLEGVPIEDFTDTIRIFDCPRDSVAKTPGFRIRYRIQRP